MIEPIFWLVVMAMLALGVWSLVHERRQERRIQYLMDELERELEADDEV